MATRRARSKLKRSAQARHNITSSAPKAPFIEHVYELRRRLFCVAASVVGFSVAAYFVQEHIVRLLLAPAGNQPFAQTTPGGGFDFLFRICLYTGVVLSVPVLFNQLLKYITPLVRRDALAFIRRLSVASWILALAGVSFGYLVGLPAALHFLLGQFSNPQIQTLITIQSYLSFVMVYLLGAALLFQLPLFMLAINKIKPLKPSKLFSYERWVVLFAAIAGGVLSPSPNIMDQILLAGPMIATYQVGILLVWLSNRKAKRPKKVTALLQKDELLRLKRLEQFEQARAALHSGALQAQTAARPAEPAAGSTQAALPDNSAFTTSAENPDSGQAAPLRTIRQGRNAQYLQSFQRRSYLPGRVQL